MSKIVEIAKGEIGQTDPQIKQKQNGKRERTK